MILKNLFFYCSQNRRSDRTVIEIVLGWSKQDEQTIGTQWARAMTTLQARPEFAGIGAYVGGAGEPDLSVPSLANVQILLARMALALQKSCGHDVDWYQCLPGSTARTGLVIFEHEESSVGEQAGIAALLLLEQAFPGIELELPSHRPGDSLENYLVHFHEHARKLVQPADTAAIIAAARSFGVPVVKLERDPYEPVKGDFRIRMNSMLMLGHCAQRQVIDGTFAIERSGKASPLLGEHHQTFQACQRLGIPAVPPGSAVRATHSLLIANHEFCLLKNHQSGQVSTTGHESPITDVCVQVSRMLDVGLLEIELVTAKSGEADSSVPDTRVVRFNPAPRLDELCGGDRLLMQQAAEQFVRWLVPAGRASRIPIVAVTGTNGKTTTSRMIARIIRESGLNTGLQCTDGRYVNGELQEGGDSSTLMGHYRLFEDRRVQAAVLETHHRGMAEYGFAFDRCDVAVCTNVTYEHIGYSNIHSVTEMAELKRSLPERARQCAVLNADDDQCLAMVPHLDAPVCLVSAKRSAEQLFRLDPRPQAVCVLEQSGNENQVVFYPGADDPGERHVLMPLADIPATYGGAAGFNVLNAMQAMAAARALGISDKDIRTAMSGFSMNASDTPWRINFYEGLPFRVLVDFAHNPDGILRLTEFAQNLDVQGRRIAVFSSFRSDETIHQTTDNISNRYDHYFIKEYGLPAGHRETVFPRKEGEILAMIRKRLIENGIDERKITMIPDEMACVKAALDFAGPGDLVVMMLGYTGLEIIGEFMEKYTAGYNSGQG